MSDALAGATGARFLAVQRTFRSSAFRLETMQSYAGSGEDAALAAFQADQPQPPLSADDLAYLRAVAAARQRGAVWQRVHIVREPLSEYLKFELTWEYGPNVEAGEGIGIVSIGPDTHWPSTWDVQDFWLFDDDTLFAPRYDGSRTWLGLEDVRDPARIRHARQVRKAALESAEPWREYVARHPALLCRISTTVGPA